MLKPHVPFLPMEPILHQEAFDDPDYGFQIKWDGVRILAHLKDGRAQLYNRKKNNRTVQYPEVVLKLPDIFKYDVILDGEVVTLRKGKPSFSELIRRDFATATGTIKFLIQKIPITYVVFDILYYNGKNLTAQPFRLRDELLKTLIPSKDPIVTTDTFPQKGTALFSVVKQAGLEGIVAKKLSSPYQVGKKSPDWLKVKNRRNMAAFIGGYLADGREVRSLFLGVFQDKDFLYIGRAGSGLNRELAMSLFYTLQESEIPLCPFINSPAIGKREVINWVNPRLEVMIEYMDFTDAGFVRHPVIKQVIS